MGKLVSDNCPTVIYILCFYFQIIAYMVLCIVSLIFCVPPMFVSGLALGLDYGIQHARHGIYDFKNNTYNWYGIHPEFYHYVSSQ